MNRESEDGLLFGLIGVVIAIVICSQAITLTTKNTNTKNRINTEVIK